MQVLGNEPSMLSMDSLEKFNSNEEVTRKDGVLHFDQTIFKKDKKKQ